MIAILLALSCGTERVDVKQLHDDPSLATQAAAFTTIADLRKLPLLLHNDSPRTEPERRVVRVDAWVVGFKLEADSDWHVVIRDDAGLTMIAEFVDPHCAKSFGVSAVFADARGEFIAVVGITPVKKYHVLAQPIPVAIAGPVFLDRLHGQTGVAPNGVEIHPVTWIATRSAAKQGEEK